VVPQFLPNLRSNPQFKKLLRFYWSSFAHWLRLSAYFKGVRHRHEETAGPIERRLLHAHKRWTLFKRAVTFSKAPLPSYEDSYMRVPYADSVPLVRPRRNVFVPVNERGIPLTDEGKITVVYQDRVCRAANRNPSKDYMMVHLPALYPLRFWIFCISIWLAVSWTLALVIFTPIVVGRQLTFAYYGYWVHDGYSFVSLDTFR
jgi:E3 ubiquitin-protein ligase DOA10